MSIWKSILKETKSATIKHPKFPMDILHQVAVLSEECGEVSQAALDWTYGGDSQYHLEEEIIQVAAVCVRMLESLEFGNTAIIPEEGVK